MKMLLHWYAQVCVVLAICMAPSNLLAQTAPFRVLFTFHGADGAVPNGLIQARDGNFYGTTMLGGSHAAGTVFKANKRGALISIHSFSSPEGTNPVASLVQASDGYFYGTNQAGGAHGEGTVFRINSAGAVRTLHSFDSSAGEGCNPEAPLVQASDGNLYGRTFGCG